MAYVNQRDNLMLVFDDLQKLGHDCLINELTAGSLQADVFFKQGKVDAYGCK